MFDEDCHDAERTRVTVPTLSGGPMEVDALLMKRISRSPMDKYWARAAGYPLFACAKPTYRRVLVSIDAGWRDQKGQRPCLRGLGFALEREEVEARGKLHGKDDRTGPPRFDDGSCDNEDPWYDGRSFEWTIVDTPWSGTEIPYERVLEILRNERYWETEPQDAAAWLVWTEVGPAAQAACVVERPDAIGRGLEPHFQGMRETEPRAIGDLHGYRASERLRRFATGLTVRIACLERIGRGTVEGLLAAVKEVEQRSGDGPADYRFVRVQGFRWTPDAALETVRALTLGDAERETAPVEGLRAAWVNARSFVCVELPGAERIDTEPWFYAVFLRESLDRFSHRVAGGEESRDLVRDFLRFQSRDYEIQVGETARTRYLADRGAAAMALRERDAQVEAEIDRLSHLLEVRSAERMQWVLYFIAVSGVFQTVCSYFALNDTQKGPAWRTLAVLIPLALVAAAAILWPGRKRGG